MLKPEPQPTRGQLRVWLKWAVQSGLLDKLPPSYDLDEPADPPATEQVARQLLAELRDPDLSGRPLSRVTADIDRFRRWVESRQRISRQIILTELEMARSDPAWLENWASASAYVRERENRRGTTSRHRIVSRSDPMWDEHLDG
jgi:hypothetical protein